MSNFKRDTGRARLPALPPVNAQDPALRNWMSAVAERLEVREGSRGNPFERAVTVRELKEATNGLIEITDNIAGDRSGVVTVPLTSGLVASIYIDRFMDSIRNTRLYRDLMRRLDDPTRFDDLIKEVRDLLLVSIAEEAAKRGADVRNLETKIQDVNRSIAIAIREVTASLENNAAGLRETVYAFANQSSAQAGKITQLEASLGNYYQDGQPGRAVLEQQLGVFADRINGLRAQYTLKVQAGGALAGFGLAAGEVNGVPSSAFLISADKFAIVTPGYNKGLTNNPSALTPADGGIPFGVDANGIYLNNNVYIRGTTIVDAGGNRAPLSYGLRGSLNISVTTGTWSDTAARQAIWSALGRSGSATDNRHLVIGDTVTFTQAVTSADATVRANATKYWGGSSWLTPGVVINGNLLVDGSVAAQKIDTRGLTVRDANGNVILGAGTNLDWSFIRNQPSNIYNSNITLNANGTLSGAGGGQVTLSGLGAGALATKNDVRIGSEVKFPDGSTMQVGDFVSRLSKIGSNNISTFMESAAIGSAYIGNAAIGAAHIQDAAVNTLKIAGNAVTVPVVDQRFDTVSGSGSRVLVSQATITLSQPGMVFAIFCANQTYGRGMRYSVTRLVAPNGQPIIVGGEAVTTNIALSNAVYLSAGTHTWQVFWQGENDGVRIDARTLFVMGVMR